jgi:hypothetical protein
MYVPVAAFYDHPDFGAKFREQGQELKLSLGQNLQNQTDTMQMTHCLTIERCQKTILRSTYCSSTHQQQAIVRKHRTLPSMIQTTRPLASGCSRLSL